MLARFLRTAYKARSQNLAAPGKSQIYCAFPSAQHQIRPVQTPSAGGANDYQLGPRNELQPQPNTQRLVPENDNGGQSRRRGGNYKGDGGRGSGRSSRAHQSPGAAWKMFEAAATTAASLSILGLAGYGYHKYYKYLVLKKIDNAFNEGDPALNLAGANEDRSQPWILLDCQKRIDKIVAGEEQGHYYLFVGEKGTGKTSMLLSAMLKTQGDSCSMMEAHSDPEIFRLRLGKALDFEFHEDYIGSLFSIHGPRETTALLDIERALNKLEKVALIRRKKSGKPLVMIVNGMHMVRDDDVGRDLLELLQQRAECWAAAGLITMIFNSDDYWVYERLKHYGSRMELISVRDLEKPGAIIALRNLRKKYGQRFDDASPSDEILEEVYKQIGGRLSFLNKVAKAPDMLEKCKEICQIEKTWFLNKCWIFGEDMDDDVMNQQKFASSAMLLVKRLVDMEKEMGPDKVYDPVYGHRLPEIPLHEARHVMTRADFIQEYDHDNIFTIDSHAAVRADSVPMMIAFREVAGDKKFAAFLEETMERIGDIESLGRTREVTLKDLWNGGEYSYEVKNNRGRTEKAIVFSVKRGRKGIHGDEGAGEDEGAGGDEDESD